MKLCGLLVRGNLVTRSIVLMLAVLACSLNAWGQSKKKKSPSKSGDEPPPPSLLQYIAPRPVEMLVGLNLTAPDGNMINTTATTVFPTDWPEQVVEILEVNFPAPSKPQWRDLPGGNKQLLFQFPIVQARSTLEATLRVRVTKSHIVGPEDTTKLVFSKRPDRDVKLFTGNSPYIEANSADVRKIVKEIVDSKPLTPWQHVEKLYDWVRDNISYQRGELKSVKDAIRDKSGDCEEMTSLFVALCRASNVPARCVWIPNHCYPEFYMVDEEGNGTWFPCQVAGTRNFGSMPEYLPILQKGDRFKVPEKKELQRYLADYLTTKHVAGNGRPKVEFIRQLLGDAATLRPPEPPDATATKPGAEEK